MYEYIEYPRMLHRVKDGVLENITVSTDEEKEAAITDGYTTDYASLVNDDGTPKLPLIEVAEPPAVEPPAVEKPAKGAK